MQPSHREFKPRNGHTLIVGIVARISGCSTQKDVSLDDQVAHAKLVVTDLWDGLVEYRIVATKGKGERLDRPELDEIKELLRSRQLDLLIQEDIGRLVRGAEAVHLWGIAVDHGVRCIAPHDCCDTADESWEEDVIAACRDHVGHNSHTSKRLKKKLMLRFERDGAAMALPIAGYVKPPDAQTYFDWRRDESATPLIKEGLRILVETLNCSAVADFFNRKEFSPGPYARRAEWDGKMVRRFFQNRLLAGQPERGRRQTVKHHESGRRRSVPADAGHLKSIEVPHLAHVTIAELESVNRRLDEQNASRGRKKVSGVDPLAGRHRKRSPFPGQHAKCWYCGRDMVWGGNGQKNSLMCTGARSWKCWNSIAFNAGIFLDGLLGAIASELEQLPGFESQFRELIDDSTRLVRGNRDTEWNSILQQEAELEREEMRLVAAVKQYDEAQFLKEAMAQVQRKRQDLELAKLLHSASRQEEPVIPSSLTEVSGKLKSALVELAKGSDDFASLMKRIVPVAYIYNVRLVDGGHVVPRAYVELSLAGDIADADRLNGLKAMLSRVVTIDLFRPAQRNRIRRQVVELSQQGVSYGDIARLIEERPTKPAIVAAMQLHRLMSARSLQDPYVLVLEPPADYGKLRRHENERYQFSTACNYERPPLLLSHSPRAAS